MKAQSADVGQFFDKRAAAFDALYEARTPFERFDRAFLRRGLFERVRLALREMPSGDGYTVLDVGSGSGRNAVLFAQAGASAVFGIDLSAEMTRLAEARAHADGAPACTFVQGDVMTFPFRHRYDAVVALGVFDYVEDPVAMLKRLKQLGTQRLVASFPRHVIGRSFLRKARYRLRGCTVYFYDVPELKNICAAAGLDKVELIPYPSGGLLLSANLQETR